MKIEIINTGTEILLGHVSNTHLGYLGKELFSVGQRIDRQVTVPDGEAIQSALAEALGRADLIIVTGGLGPTSDDLTREIVAAQFRRPLLFVSEIWDHIIRRFESRGKIPSENNKKQAMIPEGSHYFQNQNGTAPGLAITAGDQTIILLPGPPRELSLMWERQVFPWLKKERFQSTPLIQKQWRIIGIGESDLEYQIEPKLREIGVTEIGYCARSGEVDLRVISADLTLLERAHQVVTDHFKDSIYGEGNETMEEIVVALARTHHQRIATAESCTGGFIAHRLTLVSGSSDVFRFGWVTYGNEAKVQELGVSSETIAEHGAVSRETVEAMARGALRESQGTIALAVSGIAGPTGGTDEKPVGTCWFAWATPVQVWSEKYLLSQNRETFKTMASQIALNGLRRQFKSLSR